MGAVAGSTESPAHPTAPYHPVCLPAQATLLALLSGYHQLQLLEALPLNPQTLLASKPGP